MSKISATLYYDRSDPATPGWAYRYTDAAGAEQSGPIDGPTNGEAATLDEVLFAAPSEIRFRRGSARWQPIGHDGPGWEVRS